MFLPSFRLAVGSFAVAIVIASLAGPQWLLTEEKIPNINYNGTINYNAKDDGVYITKYTKSSLWILCFAQGRYDCIVRCRSRKSSNNRFSALIASNEWIQRDCSFIILKCSISKWFKRAINLLLSLLRSAAKINYNSPLATFECRKKKVGKERNEIRNTKKWEILSQSDCVSVAFRTTRTTCDLRLRIAKKAKYRRYRTNERTK